MNILIFSQHFWPETFRINEIAAELSKKNRVYVVSAWPNYNIKSKKKIFCYGVEKYKNVKIIRVPTIKRKNNKFLNIIFNYLSFIIYGIFISQDKFDNTKFDVVISYATSPIYQAIPAIIYSKRKKIPIFLWVQDVWPEVLKDLNIINNNFIINVLNKSVKYLYKTCDYILAQSSSIEKILKKDYKNTYLAYNPSNISKFKKRNNANRRIKKIIFAGNVGKAQALEKLINFGILIKKEKLPLQFEIIGEGSNKKNLQFIIKNKQLNKIIIFKPFMKPKKLEKYILNSDGLLVSLGKGSALSVTIPAKFQTYIAYGKPIFVFSDNIVAEIIKKYNIGFILNNKNPKKNIYQFLKMNINNLHQIKKNSEYLYKNFFEIKKNTKVLEEILTTKKNEWNKK